MRALRGHLKDVLTRVGARLSAQTIFKLNAIVNYVAVGQWLRANDLSVPRRFDTRDQLFDSVAAEIADRRVLYLEFGVARGNCIRYWSGLLGHSDTRLHGFDSFVGLPADWGRLPKGHFSTGGKPPEIDDPRVRFFVGWFEETLPAYEPPEHEALIVILDADLYSSTAYVLERITPLLEPGSYVYFDEFHHQGDELRAFDELIQRTGMRFRVVGATLGLWGVLFERVD